MPEPAGSDDTRMASRSWVRTVYLYTMALLGLVLLTIGGVRILDLGLKAFVFTQAEHEERLSMRQPPMPMMLERLERIDRGEEPDLTSQERALVRQWLQEYERWKEQADRVDPITSRRQRTASSALALILIGLPLYGYHWRVIRRE
jgi:hypothetical protein